MACLVNSSLKPEDRVDFEFLDGDVEKVRVVNNHELHEAWLKSMDGRSVVRKPFMAGYPIQNINIPTRIRVEAARGKYPCCWFYDSFKWVVCAEFKRLVEELEPDTHQFFPVMATSPDNNVIDERFLFVVCKRLDTIHHGESNLRESRDRKTGTLRSYVAGMQSKAVVCKDAIEGHHLWWDKYLGNGFLVSDQFAKEFENRNLHGMRLIAVEEK